MARGDQALAGQDETNVPSHRFPPTDRERTIRFMGAYISIYNEKTEDNKTLEEHVNEVTEYVVPKGYTVYIRSAKLVSFKV